MKFELHELEELPTPQTVAELLERMAFAYKTAESLINAYDEATLSRPLGDSDWSVKDHLAHLMVWEYSMVAMLEKKERLKAMGLDKEQVDSSDFDAMNDQIYQTHRERPLNDILDDFRETHQQLRSLLAALKDEDLRKPYLHYQPQAAGDGDFVNKPIIGWLVGDTYGHYAEHLVDISRSLTL